MDTLVSEGLRDLDHHRRLGYAKRLFKALHAMGSSQLLEGLYCQAFRDVLVAVTGKPRVRVAA